MTLKEFLEIREHRFDDTDYESHTDFFKGYIQGWNSLCLDIRMVLNRHGLDLDSIIIPEITNMG